MDEGSKFGEPNEDFEFGEPGEIHMWRLSRSTLSSPPII